MNESQLFSILPGSKDHSSHASLDILEYLQTRMEVYAGYLGKLFFFPTARFDLKLETDVVINIYRTHSENLLHLYIMEGVM